MHPEEARRGIATGRMTHLCLSNSELYRGVDFTRHEGVQRLLNDPSLAPMLLYPGKESVELSELTPEARDELLPLPKRPLIFVLDGTWRTVKRILRETPSLAMLPRFRVTPRKPSEFLVRRQPRPDCLATIEAVHAAIEHLGRPDPRRPHDNLLDVFRFLVERQLNHRRRARAALTSNCIPVPAMYGLDQIIQ